MKKVLGKIKKLENKIQSTINRKVEDALNGKMEDKYSTLLLIPALLWFLIRVIPKPTRITYPCQRATVNFIFIKTGLMFATVSKPFKLLSNRFFRRTSTKIIFISVIFFILMFSEQIAIAYYQARYSLITGGIITPLTEYGVNLPEPHRVVRVHANDATNWDFSTGYYWEYVNQDLIDQMVGEGVKELTDTSTTQEAWQTIMADYNSGDMVGIQINGNDFTVGGNPLSNINTLPHIVNGIIKGLVAIGIPQDKIQVIEPTGGGNGYRRFSYVPYFSEKIHDLYPDVTLFDGSAKLYSTTIETVMGPVYLSDLVRDVDHLIIVPIMKSITPRWGNTGTIKMMQGSISNPGSTHGGDGTGLALPTEDNPNVVIYKNENVIGKMRLIVADGIYGTWTGIHFNGGYGGADIGVSITDRPQPWITFGDGAPNLLFFAIDPVAVDCVMYDHIKRERDERNNLPSVDMAPFDDPQLRGGADGVYPLGIYEHGPPYLQINYVEVELGGTPCGCGDWQAQGCGLGGCTADEQYQIRACTPSGCNIEEQCIYDESCAPTIPSEWRTCSELWNQDCGNMPDFDNTFDDCQSSSDVSSDNHVDEIYLNASDTISGQTVRVKCEFDPYSEISEEYIWYYNSLYWRILYEGNAPNNQIHNVTVDFVVDDVIGEHWVRCITDGDGTGITECEDGTWFDHDDANFNNLGRVQLSLSPNPIWGGKILTATASGLAGFDEKKVYIKQGMYKTIRCSCILSDGQCSCDTTSPKPYESNTITTLYAQIDLNDDEDFDDVGEEDSEDLIILCRARGEGCTDEEGCCFGSYCRNSVCSSGGGGGGGGRNYVAPYFVLPYLLEDGVPVIIFTILVITEIIVITLIVKKLHEKNS